MPLSPHAEHFLYQHGMDPSKCTLLPGDASARRYTRLGDSGLLLMEDPDDPKGFAAFVALSNHLAALGLSAPQITATAPAQGLALIEDFGDATYGSLLQMGAADETELYALAIEALCHLHGRQDAASIDLPTYGLDMLLDEVSIFSKWFVPALRPNADTAAFDDAFRALWQAPLDAQLTTPKALVLRDFHIDNLMILTGREGIRRCGLLDFQDAVLGPAAYDLVSLLQDARRDLAPGLEQDMLTRYIAQTGATPNEISRAYHVLGAQRHTRIAGLFLRLNKRDGKPGYLNFLPRVIGQMAQALTDAGLTEISAYLDTELPGWRTAGPRLAGA